MAKHQRKVTIGLDARKAHYLEGVPDSLRQGYTKPGSQNYKKSYRGKSKR